MSETVLLPGGRDVRGSLDRAAAGTAGTAGTDDGPPSVVVACPPHPQHRGHRGDQRLVAVSDHLTAAGVDCLRFDYGEWDEGRAELTDVQQALRWVDDSYDRVGLFGFSFGATLSLVAAGAPDRDVSLAAVSALAPTARIRADRDAVSALDGIDCPAQVVVASRDTTADWEPVATAARRLGLDVTELPADHFFVGQADTVADHVGDFLLAHL